MDLTNKRKKAVDSLAQKERELLKLNRKFRKAARDLDQIAMKHNSYHVGGDVDDVMNWFDSMPIENLRESLDKDHNYPRTKFSLSDMHERGRLRRQHDKKEKELLLLEHKRTIAEIDVLLEKIKKADK